MKLSKKLVISVAGIISSLWSITAKAQSTIGVTADDQAPTENQVIERNEKDKQFLNYIVENQGLTLNQNNELNFNHEAILQMIKRSMKTVSSESNSRQGLNELLMKMKPGKYGAIQRGAHDYMSMSFDGKAN